jgi:asparagine synthase (glutamine-hydrolysing)
MPGITGFITKNVKIMNRKSLNFMIKKMMHEEYYNYGKFTNKEIGVYIGWVCHKNSFVDCMPIWNEEKNKCLFVYGEIFSEKKIIENLIISGHNFNSGNASYLIHLYENNEKTFFLNLNGFFHGILIDFVKNEICIFNDRYGMQRLYYYENKDTFYFSGEAKSLLKICPEVREIVPESLAQLISIGCVLGNNTLYKNIYLLPGASLLKFKHGKIIKKENYLHTIFIDLMKSFILGRVLDASDKFSSYIFPIALPIITPSAPVPSVKLYT